MRGKIVTIGDIEIDFDSMEIRRAHITFQLTVLQLRVIRFLIDNPCSVLSREKIIRAGWPPKERKNLRGVDNCIVILRRILEEDPSHPIYLHTIHGVGYKFVPHPQTNMVSR
jgi:DNA-binding response OmpR family regulator